VTGVQTCALPIFRRNLLPGTRNPRIRPLSKQRMIVCCERLQILAASPVVYTALSFMMPFNRFGEAAIAKYLYFYFAQFSQITGRRTFSGLRTSWRGDRIANRTCVQIGISQKKLHTNPRVLHSGKARALFIKPQLRPCKGSPVQSC